MPGSYICKMKLKTLFSILIIALLFPATLLAQEQTTYPPDGLYTSFFSFRKGKPDLLKANMIRSITSGNDFTIRQWVSSENLYYLAPDSSKKNFDSKEFWGYVENGNLYLALGYKFHKVTLLGTISYFLESYPVIKGNMAPVVTESKSTAVYRLLDMETGELSDYNVPNLEELLAPDDKIFAEFKAIESPKIKKKKMYSYMEMYNKAHPLLPLQEL